MKYIDEYRDKELVLRLIDQIKKASTRQVSFMEVCGGHTMSIQKFGIPTLLPETIKLISGPGCPVCVSDRKYIDQAIAYSRLPDVIITTYGDLIRVPGSTSSLDQEKAKGADVRIVYSILDALMIAKENKNKKIIFLGIGFETTAPSSAAGIIKAQMAGIRNFYLFSSHKIMPPAMEALIDEGVKLNGYIAPGHVSTITGTGIYKNIPAKYGLGCVVSGFEPVDLLQAILMLVIQVENNDPKVEIAYTRVVKPQGNIKAQQMLEEVFELRDDWWRGLGILPKSGMAVREKYELFDAEKQVPVEVEPTREDKGCICGEILKGLKNPKDCKLFAKACTPNNPVGACMVSHEGSCHAYYRYNRD
ncbi:MAG: hydrogenase formation protein HypD [Bacteroidales bacterium]|nr:hydrogenase formation protein HypD [Bacteroidales bacterium]MCF8402750.1 hydrogenase formation protein HypD [Bacteroidales bacterium]